MPTCARVPDWATTVGGDDADVREGAEASYADNREAANDDDADGDFDAEDAADEEVIARSVDARKGRLALQVRGGVDVLGCCHRVLFDSLDGA